MSSDKELAQGKWTDSKIDDYPRMEELLRMSKLLK